MIRAVIIDSREPEDIRSLRFGQAPVSVQALPCGDAMLATDEAMILVERKTLSDLLASIADGRLLAQAAEMIQVTPWSYLVIEAMPQVMGGLVHVNGRATQWQWTSVQGALLTVQELGVSPVWIEAGHYAETLTWLATRNRGPVRTERKREAVMTSPGEIILTALPGISDVRAQALLKHCGTAAMSLVYLTGNADHKVPGVGPATMQGARSALGIPDDMQLELLTKEN